MPVTVRTFASLGEAASTLGSEREARFFGGGTLLMRAVNEGNPLFRTLVRTTDLRLKEIRTAGQRIAIGAGVTMAEILRSRELDFLHPAASAARRCAAPRPSAAISSPRLPTATSPWRFWRWRRR
jgi:xanthine dehydrogenase small subunit